MKNPIDLLIGKHLRHRRWLQGMTQQQLAQLIGIRFQQIQKYESGANRVSAARLWQLANALNVPVSYFYGDAGEQSSNSESERASDDVLQHKETMDLIRAYYAIADGPRRCLFELAQAASKPDAPSTLLSEAHPPSQTAA